MTTIRIRGVMLLTTIRICDYNNAMVVCVCNAVNERRINEAVALGVSSIKQLCAETRAGTCCGKCLPEAKRVLDQAVLARASNALSGLESAA